MKSKNTGNYRICRHQRGVGKTRSVLSEYKNEVDCRSAFNNYTTEVGWEYYCEQEVIYTGTQIDENGNIIDSSPTWIPMN